MNIHESVYSKNLLYSLTLQILVICIISNVNFMFQHVREHFYRTHRDLIHLCCLFATEGPPHAPDERKSGIRRVKREAEALLSLNPSCTL
jgi:hypothetical protein